LSSAYRQLRELLTTFRLKIDTEGLLQALEETVKQHQSRSAMNIALDFNLGNIPLSPNEEIHLLQIIRGATQNAVHHSKGDNVTIGLDSDHSKRIHLSIKDDGVGIPYDPEKLNHYGLVIMKERSRNLGGALNIGNHAAGGVCVDFSFVPAYVS
jgi:two-component system nitrate/nitrite sensor histidine kinase NarX